MRFAEVTQEVMVSRPQEVKKQVGLAPGRHRANMLFKAALKETRAVEGDSTSGPPSSHQPVKDVPHPYLLALGVLSVQKYLSAECGEESLKEFRESLENRGRVRSQLIDDLKKKQRAFREQLCVMEGQLGSLQTSCEELGTQRKNSERKDKENNRLKTVISSQDENIARLQAELERCHAATMSKGHELSQALQQVAMVTEQLEHLSQERELLLRTTEMYEVEKRELQDELSQLQHRAEQDEEEKDKIKQRMTGFVSQEKEKFERLATHMKTQQRDLLAKSAQIQQVSG
ncbi:Kinesin-like protein KIF23, partial [Geodia barretti]